METHKKQWEFLTGKFKAGQLGHAYIFSGEDGIQKKEFALEFIKHINRQIPGSDMAINKEQFPDLLVINSINSESSIKNEKDMMEIDTDQIRKVNNFLSLTSYYGGYKAVIIENADRLNAQAQHSFLKTLEEPKGKTLIVFLCTKPEQLLLTIVSRCQNIHFSPLKAYALNDQDQRILQELTTVMNSDLATKFNFAKKANLEGDNLGVMLTVLQRYFRNAMLIKIGVVVGESENRWSLEALQRFIRLIESLRIQMATTNVNPKLALEILLLELS